MGRLLRVCDEFCLTTRQRHISMTSSKEGESQCHWVGCFLKLHENKKILALILLVTVTAILHNSPPPSGLPHASHEGFKVKCRLIYFSLYFAFSLLFSIIVEYYNHFYSEWIIWLFTIFTGKFALIYKCFVWQLCFQNELYSHTKVSLLSTI